MITCILSNLPEEYHTIVENLEDELDDKDGLLTIQRIRDKLLVNFDQINEQSRPRTSREHEKFFYKKSQYKVTFMACGKYWHKVKDCWHKYGVIVSKFHYSDKPGYIKK